MEYLLLTVIGIIACLIYGFIHKRKSGPYRFKHCWGDFGGGSAVADVEIPPFEADPFYQESQDVLMPFGKNILQGNIPDYFASIGQTGGIDFENMASLVNRDILRSTNEGLSRRGINRGGLGLSIASKASADAMTKLRWSDFVRAIAGKQALLGAGLNTVSGVRSGALSNQGQMNEFSLGATKLSLEQAAYKDQQQAAEDKMWTDLIKAGVGTVAMIATGGAAAPATLPMMMGSASPSANMAPGSFNASELSLGNFQFPEPGSY